MANELKKIQNRIYKAVSACCGKMHSDDAWQGVSELVDIIWDVEGVKDIAVGAGVYHNYITKQDPTSPAYRDYKMTVFTDYGNLSGYIRCCAAGTAEDEFSRYDMVISLYPDRGGSLDESKTSKSMKKNVVKINENTIRKIVRESIKGVLNESIFSETTIQGLWSQLHDFEKSLNLYLEENPDEYLTKSAAKSVTDDIRSLENSLSELLNALMTA